MEDGVKTFETPSFYRSMSQDESNPKTKYFGNSLHFNYDSPERYLYEFFKNPEYMKFRKEYYQVANMLRWQNPSQVKKMKIGRYKKDKTLFLEIDQVLVLISNERIPNCPVVSLTNFMNFFINYLN